MKNDPKPVHGNIAPPPRATAAGALWLACILSVPVFILLATLELLWRAFL